MFLACVVDRPDIVAAIIFPRVVPVPANFVVVVVVVRGSYSKRHSFYFGKDSQSIVSVIVVAFGYCSVSRVGDAGALSMLMCCVWWDGTVTVPLDRPPRVVWYCEP